MTLPPWRKKHLESHSIAHWLLFRECEFHKVEWRNASSFSERFRHVAASTLQYNESIACLVGHPCRGQRYPLEVPNSVGLRRSTAEAVLPNFRGPDAAGANPRQTRAGGSSGTDSLRGREGARTLLQERS